MPATKPVDVDLALQGGGSHGAFTWGVVDRLLEEDKIVVEAVSGTSAGAMNACALVEGLTVGGPQAARDKLREYWAAVSRSAALSPFRRSPWDQLAGRWSLANSPWFAWSKALFRQFSPYEFNPLDINPLKNLVESFFDFEAINSPQAPKIFLCATNVRTGRPKIFRKGEITAETVLASACLPFLSQAVVIDGEAYWDGGYMGNPPLFPLIDETNARDLILVQINPFEREGIPKTAFEIDDRLNEITFNASLIKEMRSIYFLLEIIHEEGLEREAYRDARMHMIANQDEMVSLGASSKLNAEEAFLKHLFDIGRRTADRWLETNGENLGKRHTFRPDFVLEESLAPAHLAGGSAGRARKD